MLIDKKAVNQQAKEDLREKLRLERIFKKEIKRLFGRIKLDFKVNVSATGFPQDAKKYTNAWQELLLNHYKRVQNAFKGTVLSFNGKSFEDYETKEEDTAEDELLLLLLLYREEHSIEQANYITSTTNRNLQQAVNEARIAMMEQGELITDKSLARVASQILGKKFDGRTEGIATLETQNPAEKTKNLEAEVMSKRQVKKTWRTIGDNKVRDAHKNANYQTVELDDAFIVGGQRLMFPGDTSLGATIDNVIHCRCSSVYKQG